MLTSKLLRTTPSSCTAQSCALKQASRASHLGGKVHHNQYRLHLTDADSAVRAIYAATQLLLQPQRRQECLPADNPIAARGCSRPCQGVFPSVPVRYLQGGA